MTGTDITWGQITAITPDVEVRFSGDTVSQVVGLANPLYTPATNDKVVLARVGKPDGWVILCEIGAA